MGSSSMTSNGAARRRPAWPVFDADCADAGVGWQGSSDSNRGPSVLETDALTS